MYNIYAESQMLLSGFDDGLERKERYGKGYGKKNG